MNTQIYPCVYNYSILDYLLIDLRKRLSEVI